MNEIFAKCIETHDSGQKEYADDTRNVFANFSRIANRLDLSQEEVLLVYLFKHIDGITSHVKGHESQREDVRGRITDAIVYLCILWGMCDDHDVFKDQPGYFTTSPPVPNFEEK